MENYQLPQLEKYRGRVFVMYLNERYALFSFNFSGQFDVKLNILEPAPANLCFRTVNDIRVKNLKPGNDVDKSFTLNVRSCLT